MKKKVYAKVLGVALSVAMCLSAFSSPVYAINNETINDNYLESSKLNYNDNKELVIVVDSDTGNVEEYITSDFNACDVIDDLIPEVMGGSTAEINAVDIPYSGGVAFGGNTTEANSPVFIINAISNYQQVVFHPSNFVGNHIINGHVMGRTIGETNYVQLNNYDDWDFSGFSTVRIIVTGTQSQGIDRMYIRFEYFSGYATSFDYTVYWSYLS